MAYYSEEKTSFQNKNRSAIVTLCGIIGFILCAILYKDSPETSQVTGILYSLVVGFLGGVISYSFFDLILPNDFLKEKDVNVPTQA